MYHPSFMDHKYRIIMIMTMIVVAITIIIKFIVVIIIMKRIKAILLEANYYCYLMSHLVIAYYY